MAGRGKSGVTIVRTSKYRHMFGTSFQLRDCYGDIRLGVSSQEANPLVANALYFAVPWQVPGSICITPLERKGAVPEETPLILNDTEGEPALNEIKFNPHDDNLIGAACQDCAARVWRIPVGGLTENITTADVTLTGATKRLLLIDFHPLANTVILTSGGENDIKLYDINKPEQPSIEISQCHKALVTGVSWNYDGALLASSCKDKNVRLFDPRKSNPLVSEVASHQGAKSGKLTFLGPKPYLATIGFSKTDREIVLHDIRNFSTKLSTIKIDAAPATPLPMYDEDIGVLYLAGKGEGAIKPFEGVDEDPYLYPVTEFKAKEPATGMARLPKSFCTISKCEVTRFLKLTPQGQVIPIRFEVPRANMDFFQEDLYPDTWDRQPTVSSDGWFSGETRPPATVSLKF